MIRLDTANRTLQLILSGPVTTNQLPAIVCYSDKSATAYSGATTAVLSNGATAVTICAAPPASTVRDIDTLTVQNADTTAVTATVRLNDNGMFYTLFKATLSAGDQISYTHGQGWKSVNAAGALVSGATGPAGAQGATGPAGAVGLGLTPQAVGFTETAGTTPKTLTVDVDLVASTVETVSTAATITANRTFQANLIETPVVATAGASYTVTERSLHFLTLSASTTLTFPANVSGKQFTLGITQDAIGSRTVNWPATVRWAGGTAPTLTATASKTDVLSFLSDGTVWLGFVGGLLYTRA